MNPLYDPAGAATAIALGYAFGSIPFGLIFTGLAAGYDIRRIGSGNIGATNVLRAGHRGLAVITLLADAGKAAMAVFVADALCGAGYGIMAGMAAVVGHCVPVWIGFRGGKGVAPAIGFLVAAMPATAMAVCLVWAFAALLFRYSSLASLLGMGLAPLWAWLAGDNIIVVLGLSALIIGRHIANISRLLAGTEPRIGQK